MKSRTVQPIRSGKRSGDHFITSFLRWYQKKKAKEQYFDYNLLMILCLLSGAVVILCSMFSQIIIEQIDPRIRAAKRSEKFEVTIP